jgi:CheY-like chemotaxis protein
MKSRETSPHAHTVLLVEDDPDTRDAMQALLKAHGYAVVCAFDGTEALSLARREPQPCVILLDLTLPRMDGYEFRCQQRADPAIAGIPVVAVSGMDDLARRALLLQVPAYVQKPPDIEQLMATLERLCDQSRPTERGTAAV